MSNETKDEILEEKTQEDTANIESNNQDEIKNQDEEKGAVEKEIISEFAPAPINIPNYNKEKEMAKAQKAKAKKKKRKTKKSRRRRRLVRKIVFAVRTVLLFVLLFVTLTTTLATLIVKMNTSEYSMQSAIRTHEPESFVVGKIKNPSKLNMKESSPRASVADVIRDNSMILVSYADIRQAILKSSYPDYIAGVAHDIMSYYIYGEEFDGINAQELSQVVMDNVSYLKLVTGIELGESACQKIGKYMAKATAIKELSPKNLSLQKAADYTHITSVLFSNSVLIGVVVALLLLLVLVVIACNKFAHKVIGWTAILSGVTVGVTGFLFKPMFKPSSDFVKSIVNAITKSFNQSAIIYGAIIVAVGVLVLLIGRAMSDDDYDESEEYDYIDEIEQVSTAQ